MTLTVDLQSYQLSSIAQGSNIQLHIFKNNFSSSEKHGSIEKGTQGAHEWMGADVRHHAGKLPREGGEEAEGQAEVPEEEGEEEGVAQP